MSAGEPLKSSPRWNSVTKTIAGFTLIAALAGLLIHFQSILPQILMIVILAYLVNPVANFVTRSTRLPWKGSVSVVFLLLVAIYLGLIAWSGVSVVKQILNLVDLMRGSVTELPTMIKELLSAAIIIGPFTIDLSGFNLSTFDQQIMQASESIILLIADGLAKFGSGAANFIGWSFMVFLGAFFVLFEEDELWKGIFVINIPGYEQDIKLFRDHFSNIWNSFFRGQITVMAIAIAVYIIVLTTLGVHYALGIAIIAGLVRFVPYIGTFFFWVILIVVMLFQETTAFGMEKTSYILIVVIFSYLIDWVMDYVLTPRIMSSALKVHPVLIMIGAIIGYGLLGLLGVLVAAPLVASILFITRYIYRKLMDMDPWQGLSLATGENTPIHIDWSKFSGFFQKFKRK